MISAEGGIEGGEGFQDGEKTRGTTGEERLGGGVKVRMGRDQFRGDVIGDESDTNSTRCLKWQTRETGGLQQTARDTLQLQREFLGLHEMRSRREQLKTSYLFWWTPLKADLNRLDLGLKASTRKRLLSHSMRTERRVTVKKSPPE